MKTKEERKATRERKDKMVQTFKGTPSLTNAMPCHRDPEKHLSHHYLFILVLCKDGFVTVIKPVHLGQG